MQNRESWRPSKFIFVGKQLIGSRDRCQLSLSSRLMADLVAERYQPLLRQYARGRLLDLGCGKVPLLAVYEPLVTEITCVDWANTLHKNEHVDIYCDLTQPLQLPDERFDTIILSDVLEHIPTPAALWTEMARVLAAGGRIVLNVPFFYWIHEAPHDYYRYTEHALRRFADEVGLNVLLVEPFGGASAVISDVLAKVVARAPTIGGVLAAFVQWGAQTFLKTSAGKRFAQRTKAVFPLGYFMVVEKAPRRNISPE